MSVRTSAGVYNTDEPTGDQRGLTLLPEPPPLLRLPQLLPDGESDGEYDGDEYDL